MGIKKIIIAVMVFNIISCATGIKNPRNLENINFYNYANAICIGSAFNDNEIKKDANRSANGYMEHGNISLDAYQELRGRVDVWLAKDYKSKSGGTLQIMKCNDFYNSGEVQEIFQKYNPCKSSDSWLDSEDFDKQCGK
jgi:hypothetical protein